MNDMKTTEEKKVMKNIIFVEKENATYEVDSLFKNSVKTISLSEFTKTIFSYVEKHPDLDLNKVVFVEYEDINELEESILNKDLEIMKLYLDNILVVSDFDIQDKIPKKVKIIKQEGLQKHLDSIFDVYKGVLVLADEIVEGIDKEIKNILTEGLNREQVYVSIEELAYLQELRYYIETIHHTTMGGDLYEPTDIIVMYLINKTLIENSSQTVIRAIVDRSLEFGDYIWEKINDAIQEEIEQVLKK